MGSVRQGLIGGYFLRGKMTQVNDRSLKLKDLFSVMVGCNKSTYMINFWVWKGYQRLHLSVWLGVVRNRASHDLCCARRGTPSPRKLSQYRDPTQNGKKFRQWLIHYVNSSKTLKIIINWNELLKKINPLHAIKPQVTLCLLGVWRICQSQVLLRFDVREN